MEFLRQLAGMVTGPGAMADDPVEAFKLYAPPSLFSEFTPEEQAAYGKQIQSQQRYVNADLRPKFTDVQRNILDALQAKQSAEAVRGIGAELSSSLGADPGASTPISRADQYRRAGDSFAIRGLGDKAKQYYEIADKLEPTWNAPVDESVDGKPGRVQYNNRGGRQVVKGASPLETFTGPTTLSQNGENTTVQAGNLGSVRPVAGYSPSLPEIPSDVREALITLGIPLNTNLSKLSSAQREQIAAYVDRARATRQPRMSVDLSDGTAVAKAQMDVLRAFDVANKEAGDPEIASRFQSMQAAIGEANRGNPQADGAIIYSVAKILDPAAAVQEGDKKTVLGARNMTEQVRGVFEKWVNGGSLTPNERANLYRVAAGIVQKRSEVAAQRVKQYQGFATSLGGKTDLIVNPYGSIQFDSVMRDSGNQTQPALDNPPGLNRRPVEWYFKNSGRN